MTSYFVVRNYSVEKVVRCNSSCLLIKIDGHLIKVQCGRGYMRANIPGPKLARSTTVPLESTGVQYHHFLCFCSPYSVGALQNSKGATAGKFMKTWEFMGLRRLANSV